MPHRMTWGSWALVSAAMWIAAGAGAEPLASTREDFRLPGTQPLTIVDEIATPNACSGCHSDYGEPEVEPLLNWQGSMMAQAGRDPLMYAALAVSNQDAPESGETCLRCHLPKGWLEGRSFAAGGTAMTAEDREGVQCGVCHRLVDPLPAPENPAEDTSILAGLSDPVSFFGGATMVADPFDRMRGPFDVTSDLGADPHTPQRSTLVSPFHSSSEVCGVCHNLRNPLFVKNDVTGEWELSPMDTPNPTPEKGFPEQSTYDEWAASEYASTGVFAPQFGGNKTTVSSCQDCHMPDVSGRDADTGIHRDDLPLHTFAGANTFIPKVLPFHPVFGSEVDPAALDAGVVESTKMLRKAATLSGEISGGSLTVTVTNETGHKLPTGYPEGRRMWLHVRALDEDRNVLLESGRYLSSTATLVGHHAEPGDPEFDPYLRVWEAEQGISDAVAAATGQPAGKSFHLSFNNVRLKDNRIPPRGFTNAAFAAVDAEPVDAVYADGQHWDEVVYPVGPDATAAEVTLYYQTTTREYIEFLRDENVTTAAGAILYDLWDQHGQAAPVAMASLTLAPEKDIERCQKHVARLQGRYAKRYAREWSKCYANTARGLPCDVAGRDARIDAEADKLQEKLGGERDRVCTGANLTPGSLGHGSSCPVPCADKILFDMNDLAACAMCLAESLGDAALGAAYGSTPPSNPGTVPLPAQSCQRQLDKAAVPLATSWVKALDRCERKNLSSGTPIDCTTDPGNKIGRAKQRAGSKVQRCSDFGGIDGCATEAAAGGSAAVQACIEADVEAAVTPYLEVVYP